MNSNFYIDICKDNSQKISLSYHNMLYNTMVIGTKGTGKSSIILKNFAYQTILNKNIGGLFITSTRNLSYEIYALAKHHKRRVLFLNPSINKDVELAIYNNDYTVLDLELDFNKLIFNNYIIIVDVEMLKTKELGKNFINFIISKLEESISINDEQFLKSFSIYIDDAFNYLDLLENILYYGREYNISSTLFFQNRNQFKTIKKDYTSFLDSNVINTIICNNLNIDDFKYYENLLNMNIIDKMSSKDVVCYLLQDDNSKTSGFGHIELDNRMQEITNKKLDSIKKNLKKKKNSIKNNNKKDIEVNHSNEKYKNIYSEVSIEGTNSDRNIKDDLNTNINKDIDTDKKYKETLKSELNVEMQETNNSLELIYGNNNSSNKIELSLDWDDDDF